jgi:hypothetical protein
MYTIEKTNYGIKLTFGGFIQAPEMEQWAKESETALMNMPANWGNLVDMRELKPLPTDAENAMKKGQVLYKQCGMKRSAVILNNAVTTMQFTKIAKETGIYEFERYFNAADDVNWEKEAVDWIMNEVDPDKK